VHVLHNDIKLNKNPILHTKFNFIFAFFIFCTYKYQFVKLLCKITLMSIENTNIVTKQCANKDFLSSFKKIVFNYHGKCMDGANCVAMAKKYVDLYLNECQIFYCPIHNNEFDNIINYSSDTLVVYLDCYPSKEQVSKITNCIIIDHHERQKHFDVSNRLDVSEIKNSLIFDVCDRLSSSFQYIHDYSKSASLMVADYFEIRSLKEWTDNHEKILNAINSHDTKNYLCKEDEYAVTSLFKKCINLDIRLNRSLWNDIYLLSYEQLATEGEKERRRLNEVELPKFISKGKKFTIKLNLQDSNLQDSANSQDVSGYYCKMPFRVILNEVCDELAKKSKEEGGNNLAIVSFFDKKECNWKIFVRANKKLEMDVDCSAIARLLSTNQTLSPLRLNKTINLSTCTGSYTCNEEPRL
jgi:hypothetical protein